jgi:hypothetical protein
MDRNGPHMQEGPLTARYLTEPALIGKAERPTTGATRVPHFEGREGRSNYSYTSYLTTSWDEAPFQKLVPLP